MWDFDETVDLILPLRFLEVDFYFFIFYVLEIFLFLTLSFNFEGVSS